MSAFQCTLTHLCAIVGTYIGTRSGRQYTFEDEARTERDLLVHILDKANVKSLDARYPNDKHDLIAEPCFITMDRTLNYFEVNPLTPAEMFNAIHCLEYQSCEFKGWPQSDACTLLGMISKSSQRRVPGYDDAPWGMDDMDPRELLNAPVSILSMMGGRR